MYMQIDEKGFIAGTNADSSRTDEVVSVSQTIAKPLVSGSVIVPPDYEEGNPIDDSCEICMNYYCDGSCQE